MDFGCGRTKARVQRTQSAYLILEQPFTQERDATADGTNDRLGGLGWRQGCPQQRGKHNNSGFDDAMADPAVDGFPPPSNYCLGSAKRVPSGGGGLEYMPPAPIAPVLNVGATTPLVPGEQPQGF